MLKLHRVAQATLTVAASLAVSAPALAAQGTITVDQTIQQSCSLSRNGAVAGRPFQLPIRLQFTVPETLDRGDLLVFDGWRVSLPETAALYAATESAPPESDTRVELYAGGSDFGGGAKLALTGSTRTLWGPRMSASWINGEAGPAVIAGPESGVSAPLPGVDVAPGSARVTFTGFDAKVNFQRYDYIYAFDLSCSISAPVELAAVEVSDAPGAPAVDALGDLQSPVAGGDVVRIQGRNFTGADAVSFGGVASPSFTVVSDGVIDAKVPARAAAEDVQVQVRRGTAVSADIAADDFDFVSPAPGSFDVAFSVVCTRYNNPTQDTIGLRLRGKVPTSVQPGATFELSDVRATVIAPSSVTAIGSPVARYLKSGLGSGIGVSVAGGTSPSGVLGDGYFRSTVRRAQPSQPVAVEGRFDGPWANPQPSSAITATAPAGGSVEVSFSSAKPIFFSELGGGGYGPGLQPESCAVAPGSTLIARVPVGSTPVDEKPVVTKVSGVAFSGVGGVVAITGQRIAGGSVKIGGRGAARIATVGSTVYVSAPPLAAGTYDVTVTTSKGTSAVTSASKLKYARLF